MGEMDRPITFGVLFVCTVHAHVHVCRGILGIYYDCVLIRSGLFLLYLSLGLLACLLLCLLSEIVKTNFDTV